MHYSNLILTLLSFIAIVFSRSYENTKDLVWFPNPNGDGTLIPASLVPNLGAKLGDISDIHFFLYTKQNPNISDEILVGDSATLSSTHFIPGAPVKLLVHGFGGAFNHDFPWESGQELLKLDGNLNIILVEWSKLAEGPDYFTAVANAQLTSQLSADLIEFLIVDGGVKREDIHLIGFSLGGQVVGQIGSRVKEPLTRITALDPAMPLFDVADIYNRTDPTDALFVEVIHTAGNGLLGYFDPCGHVDWYPNGGRVQPGCGVDPTGGCAHGRAPAMFVESIFSTVQFWGRECDTYENFQNGICDGNKTQVMGFKTPSSTRGIFFLESNSKSPFAKGEL